MIYMSIDGVPPSSNKAYHDIVVGKGKMRVVKRSLTTEGRSYKRQTSATLVERFPTELQFFGPNIAYGMFVIFAMKNVLNATWPEKAKTRYKKLDASNRLKLFEDSLADSAGIDDSQLFTSAPCKIQREEESTMIWVWDLESEGLVPYELVERLQGVQPY